MNILEYKRAPTHKVAIDKKIELVIQSSNPLLAGFTVLGVGQLSRTLRGIEIMVAH
jgi:hypothetical protein